MSLSQYIYINAQAHRTILGKAPAKMLSRVQACEEMEERVKASLPAYRNTHRPSIL